MKVWYDRALKGGERRISNQKYCTMASLPLIGGNMKFEIVDPGLRAQVLSPRSVRTPFTQALLEGKTLKIPKADRAKIGGNAKTLRNHGLRVRSGLLDGTDDVLVWTERISEDNGKKS
jgi:hypothetical protein